MTPILRRFYLWHIGTASAVQLRAPALAPACVAWSAWAMAGLRGTYR